MALLCGLLTGQGLSQLTALASFSTASKTCYYGSMLLPGFTTESVSLVFALSLLVCFGAGEAQQLQFVATTEPKVW